MSTQWKNVAGNPVFFILRDLAGGHHESRPGAEGCVGRGGLDLFRFSLSLDDVCAARACVGDEA
jgi:hypothetical protein